MSPPWPQQNCPLKFLNWIELNWIMSHYALANSENKRIPSKHAGSDPEAFYLRPVMAVTASVQPELGRIVYASSSFPYPIQVCVLFPKEGMDHIVQYQPGSDLHGLVRVWPNASGLEASRCTGIIGPGFWQDATGPLPVSHFQTGLRSCTDSPNHVVLNQPGSDLVLDDCVRFWPNGSGPEASRCARIIGPGFWQNATSPPPESHFQTRFFYSRPGLHCAKPARIRFYYGWLCQVLAKRIRSGREPVRVQQLSGPLLANASEPSQIWSGMFIGTFFHSATAGNLWQSSIQLLLEICHSLPFSCSRKFNCQSSIQLLQEIFHSLPFTCSRKFVAFFHSAAAGNLWLSCIQPLQEICDRKAF